MTRPLNETATLIRPLLGAPILLSRLAVEGWRWLRPRIIAGLDYVGFDWRGDFVRGLPDLFDGRVSWDEICRRRGRGRVTEPDLRPIDPTDELTKYGEVATSKVLPLPLPDFVQDVPEVEQPDVLPMPAAATRTEPLYVKKGGRYVEAGPFTEPGVVLYRRIRKGKAIRYVPEK